VEIHLGILTGRAGWNEQDAIHRADLLTLGLGKKSLTLGASVRIDLVMLRSEKDGIVGTFLHADGAVNAFVGNEQGHG
jgi:hypothetical protein